MGLLVALPAAVRYLRPTGGSVYCQCDASKVPTIRIISVAVLGRRFNRTWNAFMRRLDDARRHPRVRAVSYEALMEDRKPEVVRGLFEFIGLPDFWPDFSGQALKAKRPRCHLCDFHDARVAPITTVPTPEPVYSNRTAATRRHARRHPEGTLFLCFLLALLVLVVVLGAPCQRRALGDAVLLPDEEEM